MGIFGGGSDDGASQDHAAELFAECDQAVLNDAITAAVRSGWLISFGCGRDGYAASVAIINRGKTDRAWCEDAMSLDRALGAVLAAAQPRDAADLGKGPVKPSAGGTGANPATRGKGKPKG